ncbi:NADPH:quinone oxidoreductase family protein [Noviherbaspirillum sedimenti]|uniref:NADPH:quinone oxidoreductase family protein n=1 Tax=Noviherbaspirillum sedimenti TaxID=2320865 RepID=A0A3A3G2I2_9BURK|nr:NADPH:quinone oxidoreductase family protein [Noviherbaspirillum sedimenti]RJG02677.1 NADPH:quinone oxidoreductase family protein [Noviherbaspirillum sedimenti]
MKALVCNNFGDVNTLSYQEMPDPNAGSDDVLVQVRAAGVVFTDILLAEGKYQTKPALPFILGTEISGDVVAVGSNVTRFKPGDRVMSLAMNFGAFAEKIALPGWLPTRLPPNISYESGAAMMSSTATAQHALRQRADMQVGETLVVTGAAGATGSGAIQVGKAIGARVIAVCSSDEKAAFAKSQGADETINYTKEDLKKAIKERTGGRGADVVFDTVGGDVFGACARAMATNGRLLVVGFASGNLPILPVNLTLVKVYSVIGVHWLTFVRQQPELHAKNMEELLVWVEQGIINPAIDSVVPLSEGVAALKRLSSRRAMGKVVIKP